MKASHTISKVLSANDTGQTGGHQAGVLIPKKEGILSFFPNLENGIKNPRVQLIFEDNYSKKWNFTFIYYNNLFFGGTRNEYRLTAMTGFIREYGLQAGDTIILSHGFQGEFFLDFVKGTSVNSNTNVLKLGSSWKVVKK